MAEYLALDLEQRHVCGVLADVSKTGIRILKTFASTVPEEVLGDPGLTGQWLRSELRQHGIDARPALISLPREEVVIRHMELPPVGDDELPKMVSFQAATKSTVPLDQLALDFLPLPPRAGFAGRDVLLATVPRERIGKVYTSAIAAGLEVVAAGVSSISTAEIVLEAEEQFTREANHVSLVVARHGDRVEISLVGQGHLYFSHSTQVVPGRTEQARTMILAEVSRSMVALSKRMPDLKVVATWLIGGDEDDAGLAAAVKERFDCEVKILDPFRAVGVDLRETAPLASRAAYAGPIGQLLGFGRGTTAAVDFLNPRRPVVKPDYTNYKRAAIAAAAACVLIALFGYRYFKVEDLRDQVTTANQNLEDARDKNKELEPQVAVAERIDDWAAGNVNWLEQMQILAQKMEGTDRHYLSQLRLSAGAVKTLRGTITASGNAKERIDVEGLNAEFMQLPDIDVEAKPIRRTGKDGDFPYQFELDINLKKTETTKAIPGGAAGKKPS